MPTTATAAAAVPIAAPTASTASAVMAASSAASWRASTFAAHPLRAVSLTGMRGLALDAVEVRFIIPFWEICSTLYSYALSAIGAGSCGVLSSAIARVISCRWSSAHFGALLSQNGFP
jgi:hypothetical protein